MMKILFFFMGLPMMIMSFFQAVEVLPYCNTTELIVNGNEIILSQEEQKQLEKQIEELFQNSMTMPAFGVVTDQMFKEDIKEGYFVRMTFSETFEVNGLLFDQLVFKVMPNYQGFNLMRGQNGIFQGRCIYINLQDTTMQDLYNFIDGLENVKSVNDINSETKNQVEINEVQKPDTNFENQNNN